jgi:hypothetical protein
MRLITSRRLAVLSAGLLLAVASAHAVPDILLDDFAAPAPAVSALGSQVAYTTSTPGVYAGQSGQLRDTTFFLTLDPNQAGAVATVGGGSASVVDGAGAAGVFYIAYGAWASELGTPQSQGAPLNLDLTAYHDFIATFPQVAVGLNLNVVFYTSQPLNVPGAVYYASAGANLAPAAPGGSLVADLGFNNAGDSTFNYQHVDGIFFEIEGGGQFPDNSYSLTNLTIAAAPVPEPQSAALMLAGVAGLMLARRRRSGHAA